MQETVCADPYLVALDLYYTGLEILMEHLDSQQS